MKTTKEICTKENVSRELASIWAKTHGVGKLGPVYCWTAKDEERFKGRDKKIGPKFKKEKK